MSEPVTGLTRAQAYFARQQFARWLALKEKFEPDRSRGVGFRWRYNELTQHRADIDHSALLIRLLEGKEPLPEPPPLENAYPVYPEDRPATAQAVAPKNGVVPKDCSSSTASGRAEER